MEPQISTALSLLGVGMITVFVVLTLVVATGNILILIVNRLSPEVGAIAKEDGIDPSHIAAITAAVEIFTEGKGSITRIERKK